LRIGHGATQLAPQNNQLMSKHRVLSLKPHLRLEWRGQDGQDETEKPDHSASLSDSITSSTRIEFSVHTGVSSLAVIALGRRVFLLFICRFKAVIYECGAFSRQHLLRVGLMSTVTLPDLFRPALCRSFTVLGRNSIWIDELLS
jgi:hypothetical protein